MLQDVNAILHRVGELLETAYFPLLALNAVALIVIYLVVYAGRLRPTQWLLAAFLVLNTPVMLFFLGALVREAMAARAQGGAKGGMVPNILIAATLPLLLEYFVLWLAWCRVRRRARAPAPHPVA